LDRAEALRPVFDAAVAALEVDDLDTATPEFERIVAELPDHALAADALAEARRRLAEAARREAEERARREAQERARAEAEQGLAALQEPRRQAEVVEAARHAAAEWTAAETRARESRAAFERAAYADSSSYSSEAADLYRRARESTRLALEAIER